MDNNSLTDINKSMDNNSVNESIECFKKLIMSFRIQKIRTKILKNKLGLSCAKLRIVELKIEAKLVQI